jgi:carboxyl-terminal processing protease
MCKLFFILSLVTGSVCLNAQSFDNTVQNAFLISRMADKFHIQPRLLDDDLSIRVYSGLLDELDGERIFFLQEDIKKLAAWRLQLDDEIRDKRSGFLSQITGIYKQRLQQADTMIDHIARVPFVFTVKETLTASEDSSWPASLTAMHNKLYKLLKFSVLRGMASRVALTRGGDLAGATSPGSGGAGKPGQKYVDSLEQVLRKKAAETVKRGIQRMLQNPVGVDGMIGATYCQELASAYDPHTDYFPPDVKEAFETELGNKPIAFGLTLKEDEAGNVVIGRLTPGSPAFKSGGLNEGDKIVAIQWPDRDAIDVSNAGLMEMNHILSTPLGGGNAIITVRKTDGTRRQVSLYKQRLDTEDDEEKVQGFVLKGSRTIGYITLPAFYSDWEDNKGVNGCANDVARAIIRLKKENIAGLILDLRYNGGGSMQEAVELSGLFIDAGPVGQVTTRDAKVYTLKDVNRGTIYDGPLVILVNGYSASASEMVAGTLQDYNRALIAGSSTYGKATAQIVLPMDTTINPETYDGQRSAAAYIKLTTSRLYRINGRTAQLNGVKPDVQLPDPPAATPRREADEKNALAAPDIAANKYYHALPSLPIDAAVAAARKEMDSSAFFQSALSYVAEHKGKEGAKDLSLLLEDVLLAEKKEVPDSDLPAGTQLYTVTNLASQRQRLLTDHDLQEINKIYLAGLQKDPYIKVSFSVLVTAMIK